MENTGVLDSAEYSGATNEIRFTSESLQHLKETAKWGTFLAIVGFVFIGIMILVGIFFGTIMSSLAGSPGMAELDMYGGVMGAFGSVLYIAIAIIYLYPMLKLFQFSKKSKLAIATNSTELMTEALGNLKSLYKFMGILIAIILGFYVLIFLFTLIMGIAA